MKTKIRQGTFETNSSSTHAISIKRNVNLFNVPKKVEFRHGQFGWEERFYDDLTHKAAYLFTAILCLDNSDNFYDVINNSNYIKSICKILTENCIEYEFFNENIVDKDEKWFFIDHSDELDHFVEDVTSSSEKLLSYLFSDESFISTGNDNDDSSLEIGCDHYIYEKGN